VIAVHPFIEIDNVTKRYGDVPVLQNIDLHVNRHEVVSLIGASGSGKSTLLRCINGLETIEGGQISIGQDVVSCEGIDHVQLRRRVGMVFQSFNLFPHMSVAKNCWIGVVNAKIYAKPEAQERAVRMLERVGLADKANSFPDQLSGGQQQRVAIARAMLMEPDVLLLDEITSALDPELVSDVLNLVRELAHEGMTMIVTTHEMSFAREISNKVCFLHKSRILEQGPPEELFGNPRQEATRNFLRRLNATVEA
jgi:polar amino acid transport system ATP-binding protein